MRLLSWLGIRRRAASAPAPGCPACADPVVAPLDEVAADPDTFRYLCRCPACGQYWGGHGYTPQYRWALSPAEAKAFFPGAFGPGAEA